MSFAKRLVVVILGVFYKIYQQFSYDYYKYSPNHPWKDFIIKQDIGIEVVTCVEQNYAWEFEYVVTDEKKWFLSKLKYGI